MSNLLRETEYFLSYSGKSEKDVLWVGSLDGKYAISWQEFVGIADIEYDNGFGGQEVSSDLVVVGKGFWLERYEYDGSEGWEYKTTPVKQSSTTSFNTVCNGDSWASIEQMNTGGKYK